MAAHIGHRKVWVIYGIVVLANGNMAFRNKNYVLNQIYGKVICSNFYYKDFNFRQLYEKMHIQRKQHSKMI